MSREKGGSPEPAVLVRCLTCHSCVGNRKNACVKVVYGSYDLLVCRANVWRALCKHSPLIVPPAADKMVATAVGRAPHIFRIIGSPECCKPQATYSYLQDSGEPGEPQGRGDIASLH